MRGKQLLQPSTPFVGRNPYREIGGIQHRFIAVLPVGDSVFCIEYQMGIEQVVMFAARRADFPSRYTYHDETVPTVAAELKRRALKTGATLEAIQLLGLVMPLTKLEEDTMATAKLAKKGDVEALKTAAKQAPVSGKKPPPEAPPSKHKGNPEALAKARAAKSEGPDKRKITVLKADHGARAGTKRADLLNKMFKQKTVEAAVNAGIAKSDISWAAREGYISLD